MSTGGSSFANAVDHKARPLSATLQATELRPEDLTGGQVDALIGRDGATYLLRRAQNELRLGEAASQAAILNALAEHIALVDSNGVIVSFNRAWKEFAEANGLSLPGYGIGMNYVDICDKARDGREAAAGIRSVLTGDSSSFSIEYPCHSPTQQRWFLMTVTPLSRNATHGAVIMHLNITDRMQAEMGMKRLNRVYSVLSEINALIVRVRDRDELFRESCRIAVDEAGFRMAMLAVIDRETGKVVPVVSAGKSEDLMVDIRTTLSLDETASTTMVSRAIREKKPIVSNNCLDDDQLSLGNKYIRAGVRSLVVLPLLVGDHARGVLALYATESDFFHLEELNLLQELAANVAFAIDHVDKQERLNYLADYDELTGLAKRSFFLERLAQHMRSAAGCGHSLAIGLIDLERFKNVNDSLGRAAGDTLLKQVAQWLALKVGDACLLARIDADHFAIVVPEVTQRDELTGLVEDAIEAFQNNPFQIDDAVLRVTAKVGLALFPDDGASADILFRNAEASLKQAKASGDPCLFYTKQMTASVAGKLTLENQLRQALNEGQFVLHYQPKVNLATGKVTGVEALIRWNDPRNGLTPPDQFIPVLQETGLINKVGRWALHKAADDYLRWLDKGLAAVRIAVNVSPAQLRHRAFIDEVTKVVASDVRLAAGLELEITESLIMADVSHNVISLQAIRALGVSIAIDDFGTGFSSLSYLSRLPLDTLKIDRSFVVDMTASAQGLSLVATIINLAHSLKLNVVAEGVETEEQLRLLRLLGCDEIQGYLFSKPVPSEIFETLFLSSEPMRSLP